MRTENVCLVIMVAICMLGEAAAARVIKAAAQPVAPPSGVPRSYKCWNAYNEFAYEILAYYDEAILPSERICKAVEALNPNCFPAMFIDFGLDLGTAKRLKVYCDAGAAPAPQPSA
ncbi:hypothetical protein AMTRI_Chr02g214140 [Amborella trichopoda]